MAEKKNGDYEKPESHGEGDDLEGVSGGWQKGNCYDRSRLPKVIAAPARR